MSRIAQIKKRFAKIEWYKQGAAVRPLYVGYPWKGCIGFTIRGKRTPLNYLPFGIYLKDDVFDVYFPRHRMRQIGEFYFRHEQKQPGFILKLMQRWQSHEVHALEQAIRTVYHTRLLQLSNAELTDLFLRFSQIYTRFWKEAK